MSEAELQGAFNDEYAAQMLRDAYGAAPVPPLRETWPVLDLESAYAVQAANTRHWLDHGRIRSGAKIGLTSKSVQMQLGVDQPDFGTLFADMEIANGGSVQVGTLIQPKVEAEIAFVLGKDIDGNDLSEAAMTNAVDHAVGALEIVDSRIENWNIGLVDTVADNASCGLYVLGSEKRRLSDIDVRLAGMVLQKNGDDASFGSGAACLGNPLKALAWLAEMMARVGDPLKAGDLVLAGALGPMVEAHPGDSFSAEIHSLGKIDVAFGSAS